MRVGEEGCLASQVDPRRTPTRAETEGAKHLIQQNNKVTEDEMRR